MNASSPQTMEKDGAEVEARAADLAKRLFALPPKTRKESPARKPKAAKR